MTRTPAERQAEYRQRRIAAGLKGLTLWLPPEALAVLESYPREQRDRIAAQAILAYNGNVTVTNINSIHPALEALTRRIEALEGALTLHNSDVTKTSLEAQTMESERAVTVTDTPLTPGAELTDPLTATLSPSPDHATGLIQKAKNLHAKGASWRDIARRWNAEGIPTPSGKGQWHGANVARLVNRSYSAS